MDCVWVCVHVYGNLFLCLMVVYRSTRDVCVCVGVCRCMSICVYLFILRPHLFECTEDRLPTNFIVTSVRMTMGAVT